MKVAMLAAGSAAPDRLAFFAGLPEFRKASRNMCLAYTALENLLSGLPEGWLESERDNLGMVLGTSHGELDHTIQFLKGLGTNGIARPFLFQNSLHNATLGFLSQRLGVCGAGFTVSHRFFSGEDALELAVSLIEDGLLESCLVIGVDSLVEGFESLLESIYPRETKLGEGAGAVLLSRNETKEAPARAYLTSLRRESAGTIATNGGPGYYDSNAIEILARLVTSDPFPTLIEIPKPDGSRSRIGLVSRLG